MRRTYQAFSISFFQVFPSLDRLKVQEKKLWIVNQQSVAHGFQCDLCDAGYFLIWAGGSSSIPRFEMIQNKVSPISNISVAWTKRDWGEMTE